MSEAVKSLPHAFRIFFPVNDGRTKIWHLCSSLGLRGPGWGEPNGGYGIKMGRVQTLRTSCWSSNLKVLKVIIVHAPPPLPFPHFPERLYRRGLWSNQTFGWELKTSCIKNSEYESQAKKYMIRIARFSLLVPYPNKFLVLCICILIFHGIYSPFPLPTNTFFEGECFFRVL